MPTSSINISHDPYQCPSPTLQRSHQALSDQKLIKIVVRSRYGNVNFPCFHDDTTSLIRFYNDPATIMPRSHHAFSTIFMILLRAFNFHYDYTTSYPIVT